MTMKVRVLLAATVVMITLASVGCGHYTCKATFGASTCSQGNGSLNGGGNNNQPSGDAYAYIADPGGVQGFTLQSTKDTLVLNCTPTTCPVGVPDYSAGTPEWGVVSQKKFLYFEYSPSTSATSSIFEWTIAPDGLLTDAPMGSYPFALPFQTTGGDQAMIEDPTGTHLFMIDSTSGNPMIHVFQIGTGGALNEIGVGTTLPSGFVPYNLAMDGLGKYLYVSNVSGSVTTEVAAFSNSNGTLTAVPGSPFSSNLIQMQGDASGKYMIGTASALTNQLGNGDPHIYVLGITQSGASAGAITTSPLASAPTIDAPVSVAVQPDSGGTLVYSFSVTSGGLARPVEGYTLNASTGGLTVISGSPFGIGGDAGKFDQAGKFLFVRDSFGKFMSVFDVTTNSGDLTTTVGSQVWSAIPWAWAVTDPQ